VISTASDFFGAHAKLPGDGSRSTAG